MTIDANILNKLNNVRDTCSIPFPMDHHHGESSGVGQ